MKKRSWKKQFIAERNKEHIERAKTFRIGERVVVSEFKAIDYWLGKVVSIDIGPQARGWEGLVKVEVTEVTNNRFGHCKVGEKRDILSVNLFHNLKELKEAVVQGKA